jgi:hypothetical protein
MMKYATAGAFRTALEQRLSTASKQTGLSVQRLRKLVVFDRLLARLLVVAPDRWLPKGGLALDLRLGAKARTTKDMDLARGTAKTERRPICSRRRRSTSATTSPSRPNARTRSMHSSTARPFATGSSPSWWAGGSRTW